MTTQPKLEQTEQFAEASNKSANEQKTTTLKSAKQSLRDWKSITSIQPMNTAELKAAVEKIDLEFRIKLHRARQEAATTTSALVPPRYAKIFLEQISPRPEQQDMMATCKKIISAVKAGTEQNALIVGSVGCGKTMILSGVLNELSKQGFSGCLIRLASMMLKIKSGLAVSLAAVQDEIEYFSTVKLLVIDEVDIISPTEKDFELLHTIIDNRYNNQLSTVIVSNKLQERVVEMLGQRIVDRLRSGGCQTVSVKMDSQRH